MDTEVSAAPTGLAHSFRGHSSDHGTSRTRWLWVAFPLGVALAATVYWHITTPRARYTTTEVTTGTLTISVTATGKLQPRNQVEIGSELSGVVKRVHVDVNALVHKGQLLATLDNARLKAQLLQAEGARAAAEARLVQCEASLKEAKAYQARLLRLRTLSGNRLPSELDMDLAEANLARAEAEAAAAHAAVAQAYATRETVRTDLSKTEIRSPIDGVLLTRSIEPGQTVTASLQAPVLFVIAEDLRQMDLHVAVDEANVGTVKVGQQASFIVDAFPERTFVGRINRVHMASSNTRGATRQSALTEEISPTDIDTVVTYETVLEVDNAELMLRPGMTATAEIITGTLQRVTLVSNTALGFTPEHVQVPGVGEDSDRGRGMMALMPHVVERWKCPREAGQSLGCVWVLEDGEPQLAVFRPGAADRSMTQVLPMDQLPRWGSLARLRNDPVLLRAIRRKLTPGTPVIVEASMN